MLAPRDGFEPPTERLTVASSTAELPGNNNWYIANYGARGKRFLLIFLNYFHLVELPSGAGSIQGIILLSISC